MKSNGDEALAMSSGAPRKSVGKLMRDRRKAIGKTMQQIADDTDLTVGFISQVERDISSPSLASLYRIAKALQTNVETFFAEPLPPAGESATRSGGRPTYRFGNPDRVYEFLGRGFPGAKLNACITHVPPGMATEVMTHEGEEFVYLIRGTMLYVVDGVEHLVEAGGTLHFRSDLPHRSSNPGTETATELWVGTMPIFQGV